MAVDVKKLYHCIRTPTWIMPPRIMAMMMMDGPAKRILTQLDMDKQENFSPEQIERFKSQPDFYRDFVKTIEKDTNGTFPVVSPLTSWLQPEAAADQSFPRF